MQGAIQVLCFLPLPFALQHLFRGNRRLLFKFWRKNGHYAFLSPQPFKALSSNVHCSS